MRAGYVSSSGGKVPSRQAKTVRVKMEDSTSTQHNGAE
jgi:hypothetical protein